MNFDSRKNLIEYDDVINQQREIIYKQRDIFMISDDLVGIAKSIMNRVPGEIISMDSFSNKKGELVYEKVLSIISNTFFRGESFFELDELMKLEADEIPSLVSNKLAEKFDNMYSEVNEDALNGFLLKIYLDIVDANWQKHIDQIEKLKAGIKFRQYAQQNPLQSYIKEANLLFDSLKQRINHNILRILMNTRPNGKG